MRESTTSLKHHCFCLQQCFASDLIIDLLDLDSIHASVAKAPSTYGLFGILVTPFLVACLFGSENGETFLSGFAFDAYSSASVCQPEAIMADA
jgi:hypothetical protein